MPELPEVEVLVRHLGPLLRNRNIRAVDVRRPRSIAPTTAGKFSEKLAGASFQDIARRGKYLLFQMRDGKAKQFQLLGHLGMTGRMYLSSAKEALPKHAAVVLNLGAENFVSVAEEANASPIVTVLRGIVVEKFWRTLILPYLHISVIRYGCDQTIISHLVGVVGGRTPFLMNRRHGLCVRDLVACVPVSRQTKLVRDPFAKMTRAVGLRYRRLCFCRP